MADTVTDFMAKNHFTSNLVRLGAALSQLRFQEKNDRWFHLILFSRRQSDIQKKIVVFVFDYFFLRWTERYTYECYERHLKFKRLIWNCCWRTLADICTTYLFLSVGTPFTPTTDRQIQKWLHSPLIGLTRFCCTTRTPSANSLERTNMHSAQNMLALEFHLTAITIPCVGFLISGKSVFCSLFSFFSAAKCTTANPSWCNFLQFICHSIPESVPLTDVKKKYRSFSFFYMKTQIDGRSNWIIYCIGAICLLNLIQQAKRGQNRLHFNHSQRLKLN